ncbi:MAG: TolC family protein [Gemmatimonadales bacterium]|jgi:outer membrane protein TolC
MILELVALIQVAAANPTTQPTPQDTIPQVTLAQALQAAARLDPNYVAALGQIQNARWIKRQAQALFVVPSISASTSLTKADAPLFNVGTGGLADQIVTAQLDANYDLFRGGSKLFNLYRARAELEGATANEVSARFATALLTESDFYDVLAEKELVRVATERTSRAVEQLAVARARVVSGAAVRTDSLQLLLELTRARVDLLRQQAVLKVAQVQLGRRVGAAGPVDAILERPIASPDLPISEDSAAAEALAQGPDFRVAIADEAAAEAAYKATYGAYLPQISLFASYQGYGEEYAPDAFTRTVWGFRVNLPLWNNGQREVALTQARTNRDVARAARRDTELAVRRDAIEAYQAYNTARASAELARQAVVVARENLDVQQTRYRAGATTILDLLSAQVSLSEAEAGLVQAVYGTRLALAGLEAILGRRLFEDRGF